MTWLVITVTVWTGSIWSDSAVSRHQTNSEKECLDWVAAYKSIGFNAWCERNP